MKQTHISFTANNHKSGGKIINNNNRLNTIEGKIASSFTLFAPRNDDTVKYNIPPQILLLIN